MTPEKMEAWASHQKKADVPDITIQSSNEHPWVDVLVSKPQHGQAIEGCVLLGAGAWTEVWDEQEPVGQMRYWRPAAG